MGKSTLCRALVQELDRRTVTALVLEAPRSFDDLLKNMLASFGVMAPEDLAAAHVSRPQLTNALNSFLESLAPLNASAVVFVDQAHDIPVGLLVDLARVVAPGTPGARLLQLVLVGRPALTPLLRHADLRDLNASIARRIELGPLEAGDIPGYITHRLSKTAAGRRIDFDASAVTRLFERSSGVPRMVDLLCDRAMLRGQQAAVIDAALIEAVASDLDLDRVDGRPRLLNLLLIVAAFALLVLAGAGGALWIWRDSVSRAILEWENVPILPDGPVLPLPAPLAPIPPPAESSANLPGNPAI
jgi:general secretion pathway protein A